ncbi:helix-turn-helix transcriptional regulator [Clostridium estertheticum]|uniref:helix-turn-helix transcriptional regulator n=1 Tax=Clostridium estertheticum TaxID=238834 RepID=UPI0013E9972E|nr:helix-turn-helix transcriptional regulator [Clostridium estertheticum]MBZ9689833.1 helix-turn-helix transcriptional regulator [Clostridium estertheticum]
MNTISSEEWNELNEIIKKIYTIAINDLFMTTIKELKKTLYFSHSMYHYSAIVGGSIVCFNYSSGDLPEEHLKLYSDRYENTDFINWYADEPIPRVFRDTDLISDSLRENSKLMKKWLTPFNMFFSMGMTVAQNNYPYGNIYLFRSQSEGDFKDKDIKIFNVINEHLSIRLVYEFPNGYTNVYTSQVSCPLSPKYRLTSKEREIIAYINEGFLRSTFAERLCISENTLKKHLSNIYNKMNINTFEELVQVVKNNI